MRLKKSGIAFISLLIAGYMLTHINSAKIWADPTDSMTQSPAISHEEELKKEAAQKGYIYCESISEIEKVYKDYINKTKWADASGITVISSQDVKGINDCLKQYGRHSGYSSTSAQCVLTPHEESSSSIVNGVVTTITKLYMGHSETHYESYSQTHYEQAWAKSNSIAATLNGSDYDKIKGAYMYLIDNCSYDYTYEKGTDYDALIYGSSVCMGYAASFENIMNILGIECYICEGMLNGNGHAWNIVKLDGEYYYVDATFADTSGLKDQFLLFGTNLRNNIYDLPIANHSYAGSGDTKYDVNYNDDGSIGVYKKDSNEQVSDDELKKDKEEESKEAETTTTVASAEESSHVGVSTFSGSERDGGVSQHLTKESTLEASEANEKKSSDGWMAIAIVIATLAVLVGVSAIIYMLRAKKKSED